MIANRILGVQRSPFYSIMDLAAKRPDCIYLQLGEPDFVTPKHVREAAKKALDEGHTHYGPDRGIPELRELIAEKIKREHGTSYNWADEILVTAGGQAALHVAVMALANPGDEIIIMLPHYPPYVVNAQLSGAKAVFVKLKPEDNFVPDPAEIEKAITDKTKLIMVLTPNNPTGAVYPRGVLEAIARIAEKYHLLVLADEIYDQMTYDGAQFTPMATLVQNTLCGTLSGLSKVYRACGYRVGWAVFSGDVEHAREYLSALELLSSLRLCSNVPGQGAVQTALGGYQSIHELTSPGGRLYESRRAIIDAVARSRFLHLTPPMGACYAFVGVHTDALPDFDDQQFALDLLEHKHVLVAPGTSFNVPYRNHFRITNLPEPQVIADVFGRIEELLASYAAGDQPATRPNPALRVVDAGNRA